MVYGMNWKQLETFYLVATAKSLSKASKKMAITQGALSRHIALLEGSINAKLFYRHPKGMRLTPTGEMVYRHVCTMYAEAALVKKQLNDTKNLPSGVLKISAPIALGTFWLIPRIAKFNTLYPKLSIELNLTDSEVDLSLGDSCVALRYPVVERPDLVRKPLKTIGFYPYASTSYLLTSGALGSSEDLDDHRLIAYSRMTAEDHKQFNWILRAGNKTGRVPVLQVDNLYACYLAVKNGLGIGVLPEYFAWDTEDIVRIFPNYKSNYVRELSLYYPVELRDLTRMKVFRDFIYEELSHAIDDAAPEGP